MADIEKVIKAIDICLGHGKCNDCSYHSGANYSDQNCRGRMLQDALAMLNEQEAVEPKQVVRKQCKKEHDDGSIDYFAEWYCPHCNMLILRGFDNPSIKFCYKCGKPILWEGL